MIQMPLVWIVFPLVVGVILIPLSRYHKLTISVVSIVSLVMGVLALVFPSSLAIEISGRRFEFNPILSVLGRLLSIEYPNLITIALLFLTNFAWNILSGHFSVSQYFAPLSLVMTALWVTTLSVEPFLYAAVIIAILVLISVPLLAPRGNAFQPGLFRYLILQSLAVPVILLSGWMLAGIGSAPSASPLIIRATMMVLIGFVLWLGVFPLHSWLPMISSESHPWVVSMLLSSRQLSLMVYLLFFLDQFAWLRNLPNLFKDFRAFGLLIIAIGGISAASQKNFKRLYGYFFLIETGYSLLAIGLTPQGGLSSFSLLWVPRMLSYWLWSFSVGELTEKTNPALTSFDQLQGLFFRAPFLGSGMFASLLTLAGMPLFALFPVKRMIWVLAGTAEPQWIYLLLVGSVAMIVLIVNFLRTTMSRPMENKSITETPLVKGVITMAILLILAVGIFPDVFLTGWIHMVDPFSNLLGSIR